MWDLWLKKRRWGRFSASASVSPANSQNITVINSPQDLTVPALENVIQKVKKETGVTGIEWDTSAFELCW
jgi:hypothetical protein